MRVDETGKIVDYSKPNPDWQDAPYEWSWTRLLPKGYVYFPLWCRIITAFFVGWGIYCILFHY